MVAVAPIVFEFENPDVKPNKLTERQFVRAEDTQSSAEVSSDVN